MLLRTRFLISFSLTLLSTLFHLADTKADEAKQLLAGAAIAVINPDMGDLIVGNFGMPPATSIHDDITARCLFLDNGEERVAIVMVDSVGVPHYIFDAAREKIAADKSIPSVNILMAATHTHSATSSAGASRFTADPEFDHYQKRVVNGIYEAVKQAHAKLQPAKIGFGSFIEPSHLNNRRWHVTNPELLINPIGTTDKVRMNPPSGSPELLRPAGPVDPQFSFISVRTLEGEPLSLFANYSLHYVGGVPNGVISADYFAVYNNEIGTLLNNGKPVEGFVGLYSNGTSGDVNNINFQPRGQKSYGAFERMNEVAKQLATRTAVEEANIPYQTWVPLRFAQTELKLQVRQPDAQLKEFVTGVLNETPGVGGRHSLEEVYARRIHQLMEGPDEIDAKLQSIRIGDQVINTIPFEVFAEIGMELKEKSAFPATFNVSLANGSFGYLPTPAQHELGGYETWLGTNNVQIDASEKIVDALLQLHEQLK
ncbi:hypothetical protein SH668x_002679 [Planctomicrobium sp. SH668]|uniref:hypothetical protein n=1 Tax=Planctomicrobium sp. SH668 TaxID=3448126 RepID=UPI003F5BECAC